MGKPNRFLLNLTLTGRERQAPSRVMPKAVSARWWLRPTHCTAPACAMPAGLRDPPGAMGPFGGAPTAGWAQRI